MLFLPQSTLLNWWTESLSMRDIEKKKHTDIQASKKLDSCCFYVFSQDSFHIRCYLSVFIQHFNTS